uniref:hypothetical protein n=1 Tax=Flavobacterium sp. TaxID=239 RepID=UPI00404727FC
MKTTTFILNFLFFGIIGYSQIETKIITVDLSKPHEGSISSTNNFKWLSAKSKEMISIQLVNGNPLKYDYKIDTKNISLHNNDESEVSEIKKSVADNNLKQFYKAKLTTPLLQNIIDSNSKLITLTKIIKTKLECF